MFFWNINIRYSGNINKILDFEYGDGTEVYGGCGATLHNVFWYFGGYPNERQVTLLKYIC